MKQIADSLKDANGQPTATSETVRGALQAIVACAGAAAQSQSCGAGALAATASVALNELLKPAADDPASQEARKNIAATLIGGIAAAATRDATTTVNAAILETENNALNLPPEVRRALGGALGVAASIGSIGEVVKPAFWSGLNALRTSEDPLGLIRMGIEQTVAERKGDFATFERLNDEFGKGMVIGRSTADALLLADAIASLPLLTLKVAQLGGVVINNVRYVEVGGKIVRQAAADSRQANAAALSAATATSDTTLGTQASKLGQTPADVTQANAAGSSAVTAASDTALATQPLKFGKTDLVYGPSANGELFALQQNAGGQLLSDFLAANGKDVFKDFGGNWREASRWAMDQQRRSGQMIRFDLTHVQDLNGVLNGTSRVDAVTSFELRYLKANWGQFQNTVAFYRNGARVHPW